jgi:uncharacterized protein (DUF1330 family)
MEKPMLYALNVFSLVAGKEAVYRDYSVKAGKIIYRLGGRVVASGHQPIRYLRGDVQRQEFIVVEFPSEAVFQQFHDAAESEGLHNLREGSTYDYIWTLYQPWDLRAWVKE